MLISILGIGWFCYLFVRYKVCLKGEVYCMKKFKKENRSDFYQYCFTPGPIGVCTKIKGGEKEQDITDYGAW